MNLVDKIKGFSSSVSAKDISKKAVNLMMVPVAYFAIDKAINDYSPSVNLNSGTVYAADAMVTPTKPYKGMPLELVMNSEEGAYLPDLSGFKEIKRMERKKDYIKNFSDEHGNEKETTVKTYNGNKYILRTHHLPNNQIYSFSLTSKKTGKKVFFTDRNNDESRFFETKGVDFKIDLDKYGIKG